MKAGGHPNRTWWVYCDIDGAGRKWRIMVERTNAMMPCRPPLVDPRVTERLPEERSVDRQLRSNRDEFAQQQEREAARRR